MSQATETERDESRKALSPAERKKIQRERDKSQGWVEVTVKVSHEHADKVRLYAAQLPKPRGPAKPKKRDAVDVLSGTLDLLKATDPNRKKGAK